MTTRGSAPTDQVLSRILEDDGVFPNSRLPLVVFRGALALDVADPARSVERVFEANQWGGGWRNGIYPFHHYHSTAHEVLGVYGGSARVQLGGPQGMTLEIRPGDVIVIPAGVAHRNLGASPDFAVVGAYPDGQRWDMNYGRAGERPGADARIAQVPLPSKDPAHGADGPLMNLWQRNALTAENGRRGA
jgi:uncharacterized protein YjlB